MISGWQRAQKEDEVNRLSQESFIKGAIFPELELIISDRGFI